MSVTVVQIREVRVPMKQRLVPVLVRMGLFAVPVRLVRMPVVRIVHVQMTMRKRFMQMLVLVLLREVQPDTDGHQSRGGAK